MLSDTCTLGTGIDVYMACFQILALLGQVDVYKACFWDRYRCLYGMLSVTCNLGTGIDVDMACFHVCSLGTDILC
jgi:hypothetical protein